jgi:hypothetical protein
LAAGASEQNGEFSCPCLSMGSQPPSFLGDNYYCETGNTNSANPMNGQFYPEPLWDASSCSPSTLNTPQGFHKQLQQPTTDDIEMRVCTDEERSSEDITIEIMHIYVQ